MSIAAQQFTVFHTECRDAASEWAASGLMALTGAADGAPVQPAIDTAGALTALLDELAHVSSKVLRPVRLNTQVLTERAALMGFSRGGSVSCNRSCRLLEVRDGWIAVNLPRDCDIELLPAWLGIGCGKDYWTSVECRVKNISQIELVESAAYLGLAVAAVPAAPRRQYRSQKFDDCEPEKYRVWKAPLVVDLSALWAGPLCSHVLQLAGARVIKVESVNRPDPVRHSAPAFFNGLNAGKESVVLDFREKNDIAKLQGLMARADCVVTSARTRAFEQLGLEPETFLAGNPRFVWTAITAHGWCGPAGMRVGYGDDAAAAGGLVAWGNDQRPMFVGDAIADPLAGISAAIAALSKLGRGQGGLADTSLAGSAARIAAAKPLADRERGKVFRRRGHWWLRTVTQTLVAQPTARSRAAAAAEFGADTERVLKEFI